jgi:hypothetical protein
MTHDPSAETAFESRLTDGTDRFLSHMIEHAFAIGRRTSRDFLRHFPPSAIMEALKDSPALRADILEHSTGVKRKVALKKSALSAGEDLQIALEEGEAVTEDVVRLFRPDDRVRYLPRSKLWSFVIEGEFWKATKTDKGNFERAQQHIAFLLDRALRDQVLTHLDIIEGISVNKICHLLPRPELETAMNSALAAGRKGQPFSDRDLYDNLTALTLTNNIPLPHIWDEVVQPCAIEHGLTETHAGAARVVNEEEALKPVSANTNDQPVQVARPSPAKPLSPVPVATVKRPQPVAAAPVAVAPVAAAPVAATPKPVAAVRPAAQQEALAPEEDEAFDVQFDNLTASKC